MGPLASKIIYVNCKSVKTTDVSQTDDKPYRTAKAVSKECVTDDRQCRQAIYYKLYFGRR
jgi:hypothetical protein